MIVVVFGDEITNLCFGVSVLCHSNSSTIDLMMTIKSVKTSIKMYKLCLVMTKSFISSGPLLKQELKIINIIQKNRRIILDLNNMNATYMYLVYTNFNIK